MGDFRFYKNVREHMNNLKRNTFKKFNKAAQRYDFYAFDKSLGLRYLSYLETLFIQKHLKKNKGENLFLDLGIGTGRISRVLLKKNLKVKGMDFSEEMIRLSKQNLANYIKDKKLQIYKIDLNNKLPFPDNSFNGAICIRVIKYVKNWEQAIREVSRVTKPNSIFILEYSNFYSVQSLSQLFAGYLTFKSSEINNCLLESGFRIINQMYGVKLPFYFYKYTNSESNLKRLIQVESLLRKLLGKYFSRNTIVYSQKIAI